MVVKNDNKLMPFGLERESSKDLKFFWHTLQLTSSN